MIIVMTKLVSLDYRVNEDVHTLAYKRDVESWLKQWTVGNNFTPVCHAYETVFSGSNVSKEEIAPLVNAAKATLTAQHLATLKRVFPEHTKTDRDYSEDFRFQFEVYTGKVGEPLKYMPFM